MFIYACTWVVMRSYYCCSVNKKCEAGRNQIPVSEGHKDICQLWGDVGTCCCISCSKDRSSSLGFKDYLKCFIAIFSTNCK